LHGAEAYGFRGDVWTCPRVAQVIEWEFGIRYHRDHVSRMLKDSTSRQNANSPQGTGVPGLRATGYVASWNVPSA
jgi:hypothetical protein